MTTREKALYDLCMSDTTRRTAAIETCRQHLGRAMITTAAERANVAAALAGAGWDGVGRVRLACEELATAARE